MNREILEAYCELHRAVMKDLRSKVPGRKNNIHGREMSLDEINIDDDGCITAEYSRYMGCGDYERESVHINPHDLYKEQT